MLNKNNDIENNQFYELLEKVKYTRPQTLKKLMQTEGLFRGLPLPLVQKLMREVTHFWTKCNRPIDFRYKEEGLLIERFDLGGVIHYLDINSKKLLLSQVKRYANTYTLGVYEEVKSNFEKNKAELVLSQQLNERDINIVRFNDAEYRSEERMNLAISVTLYPLPDVPLKPDFVPNSNMLVDGIPVITSNISHNGLKIKTKQKFQREQLVIITFDDLEKELIFKQNMIIYRVLKCMHTNKENIYDCMLKLENLDSNAEFTQYVKNLIFSHKYKYKVDLDSIYASAQGKGYEQYYIDLTDSVALYLNDKNKISYVLSDLKRLSLQAFNFADLNFLSELFAKDKVFEYLEDNQECYYFIARLKQKQSQKVVFFSSIIQSSSHVHSLVQHFKDSVSARVFKLRIDTVDKERALLNSTIPEEAQSNYGTQRIHRYSQKTAEIVTKIEHLISVVPISNAIVSALTFSSEPYKPKPIDIFKPNPNLVSNYTTIMPETQDGRAEDRFHYQTTLTISHLKSSYSGVTETVSSLGLSCKIDGATQISVGSVISISFDDFVERSTKYALGFCKYTVVGFKNGILRASNQAFRNHDGRAFWLSFVLDRLDHLTIQGAEKHPYGLSRALRNLAASNTPTTNIFYAIFKGRLVVSSVAIPKTLAALQEPGELQNNFTSMIKSWFYRKDIRKELQVMARNAASEKETQLGVVILSLSSKDEIQTTHNITFLPLSKLTQELLSNTIKLAKFNGRSVRMLEIKLSLTDQEFNRYYLDELNYIKSFANHRYIALTQEIGNIKGMLQVLDISNLIPASMLNDE